jgi:hypothetical protein
MVSKPFAKRLCGTLTAPHEHASYMALLDKRRKSV